MSRLVRSTEARGSISLITRVDATELPTLADHLDPGSTVEIIITDQVPHGAHPHLTELAGGGIHIKLVGPPQALHAWLTALQVESGVE